MNGIPGEVIYNRKGLRQGDLLSPPLFVLLMDGLHFMLRAAAEQGILPPLATVGLHHRMSIYADDVMTLWCQTQRG